MLLVSKVSGPSEGFLAPYDFSGSRLDFFVYWGAVVVHVEVVVYSDPEVLDFSDLFYAFDMSERETCLCSPVGAHYLGVIESLLCCFIKGYYEFNRKPNLMPENISKHSVSLFTELAFPCSMH